MPWWFTNVQLQRSHMAALIRKNPNHYTQIFPITAAALAPYLQMGYMWPSKLSGSILEQAMTGIELPLDQVCVPMGAGIPPQYRYSKDVIETWLRNPTTNPLTQRKITSTGTLYKDFYRAAKAYGFI